MSLETFSTPERFPKASRSVRSFPNAVCLEKTVQARRPEVLPMWRRSPQPAEAAMQGFRDASQLLHLQLPSKIFATEDTHCSGSFAGKRTRLQGVSNVTGKPCIKFLCRTCFYWGGSFFRKDFEAVPPTKTPWFCDA